MEEVKVIKGIGSDLDSALAGEWAVKEVILNALIKIRVKFTSPQQYFLLKITLVHRLEVK